MYCLSLVEGRLKEGVTGKLRTMISTIKHSTQLSLCVATGGEAMETLRGPKKLAHIWQHWKRPVSPKSGQLLAKPSEIGA